MEGRGFESRLRRQLKDTQKGVFQLVFPLEGFEGRVSKCTVTRLPAPASSCQAACAARSASKTTLMAELGIPLEDANKWARSRFSIQIIGSSISNCFLVMQNSDESNNLYQEFEIAE